MRRRPHFLLLHLGGWSAYTVALFVAALPQREQPGIFIDRAIYAVAAFLCSFLLWALCRRLWRSSSSWPRMILVAMICCYPLGYLCALTSEFFWSFFQSPPPPLTRLLFSALGGFSATVALVAWCCLYFGFKQTERVLRTETLAREAELRALRYQLTPHFLYNTLNGISTLVGEGRTQDARRMIARLGDFLRTTIDGIGALEVPLVQEMHFLEQYLAIEQARLGERLRVEVRIAPETLDAQVPNLLLQPLVRTPSCTASRPSRSAVNWPSSPRVKTVPCASSSATSAAAPRRTHRR